MDQYLFQILQSENTIIIPGLGALTITNEKTGEIMFMPYLKFDDGKLSAYIAEKEGWAEFEAKNLIAKYVREIEIKLNQGDTYDMFNFGRFIKTPDGEIEFQRWGNYDQAEVEVEKEEPDTDTGHEALSEETIHPHEPENESIPEGPDEEEIVNTEHDTERYEEENQEVSEDSFSQPETIQVATETVKEEKVQTDNLFIPKGTEEISEVEKIPSKKKKGVLFWVFIIVIIAGLLFAISCILFYDQMKTVFPFMENKRTEINHSGSDIYDTLDHSSEDFEKAEEKRIENKSEDFSEQSKDPIVPLSEEKPVETTKKPVKEEASDNKKMPQSQVTTQKAAPAPEIVNQGKYHVIVGGFAEESNATRFAEKVNGINIGKYDGLYLVSIGGFSSIDEASTALKAQGKGWIFTKK